MSADATRTRFFTGRQVTTMVVAFMLTVGLVPGAVWAVDTFSNVAVMDPVTGDKAQVTAGRALKVSDGRGQLTVDGNVVARPAAPADFWRRSASLSGDRTCVDFGLPPAGKAIVLMTLHADVYYNPTPDPNTQYLDIRTGTCNGAAGERITYFTPPGLLHTAFPLDPGVVSTNGFQVHRIGVLQTDFLATGYLVSATGLSSAAQQQAPTAESPAKR